VALAARDETQRQLAAAVNVSSGSLSQVLNYNQRAWPALKRRIAAYLDLPEEHLFPDELSPLLRARAAQGLPPTVEDPDAARRIAALVAGTSMPRGAA
jgi:transcriptional regulator with XRE-family HTH domain